MDITFAGLGYVGLVNAIYLASLGNNIVAFDTDKSKISLLREGVVPIEEKNLQELLSSCKNSVRFTSNYKDAFRNALNIFISIDIFDQYGEINLNPLYKILDEIKSIAINDTNIITLSNLPIGENKNIKQYLEKDSPYKFEVISFPQFLSIGNAVNDIINPNRLIFGVSSSLGVEISKKIAKAYLIKKTPIMITSIENAELIEHACNGFIALKTAYTNSLANLCDKVGGDIEKVVKGLALDPSIGESYLTPNIGFSGPLLTTKTNSLYLTSLEKDSPIELLKVVKEANENQTKYFLNKIYKRFKYFSNLTIGVLGVASTSDSEEVRCSQAIPILKALLSKNAHLKIYDPLGCDNLQKLFSRHCHIKYVDYLNDALKNVDFVIILSNSKEFKDLKAIDFISLMKKPIVFDGYNLFKIDSMKGCEYYSIGRKDLNSI